MKRRTLVDSSLTNSTMARCSLGGGHNNLIRRNSSGYSLSRDARMPVDRRIYSLLYVVVRSRRSAYSPSSLDELCGR